MADIQHGTEGTVRLVVTAKNFGFIEPTGGGKVHFTFEIGRIAADLDGRGRQRLTAVAEPKHPTAGEKVFFLSKQGPKGLQAIQWWRPPQSLAEKRQVIDEAKPGDRLKIVFNDDTFGGDLKGRIMMLLMAANNGTAFDVEGSANLYAVSDTGRWCGFTTHIFNLRADYDAGYFAKRTLGRELIARIERL